MAAAVLIIVAVLLFLLILFLISAIKVAREYERGIIFRLGRLLPEPEGPGLFIRIPVAIVEVKDVEIPSGMQRAMARQAEAERERRAKVINAEGEFQASERLKDAAVVIADHPIALQLRYLQTLLELGSSQATTIVFPAPIDLLSPFLEKKKNGGGASS